MLCFRVRSFVRLFDFITALRSIVRIPLEFWSKVQLTEDRVHLHADHVTGKTTVTGATIGAAKQPVTSDSLPWYLATLQRRLRFIVFP